MSLANFSDLKSAITEYTTRTTTDLLGRETDFIAMIEGRFNRELRVRDMETSGSVTLSFSSGMNGGTGALPSDYLEWLDATWTGSSRVSGLRYAEPDSEEWRRKWRPFGDPALFTTLAANMLVRPCSSSTPGTVTLTYYAKIPALATNSTNWLLTRYPDAYLHGALMEAYLYLELYDLAAQYKALFDIDMAAIKGDADSAKLVRRAPSHQAETQNVAEARAQATGAA